MATATQLFTTLGIAEPHIIIKPDRSVSVPEELRYLAVQYDHNIETVTFDCPRYWDEHDLTELDLRINYEGPGGYLGVSDCKNITIDGQDDSIIHFEWTIMREVTFIPGKIKFLVCAQRTTSEGNVENCWHSRLCTDCAILDGLECGHSVEEGDMIIPDNYDLSDVIFCFDVGDEEFTPIPGTNVILRYDEETGNLYYSIT